jgi:hypothetical protein
VLVYAILRDLRDIAAEDIEEFNIFLWDKCCIPPFWRYKYSPEMFEVMTEANRYVLGRLDPSIESLRAASWRGLPCSHSISTSASCSDA